MVKNLLFFLLMSLSSAAFAQLSIDISSPTVHGEGAVNDDIMVEVVITNTSEQSVNLLWTRHIIVKPEMWRINVGVHANTVDFAPEDAPIHLVPGESYTILMQANSLGRPGFAQVELDLYDADNQENVLGVVKATFEAAKASTLAAGLNTDAIRIYPNPTSDYFRIYQSDAVNRIEIYNIVGKRIMSYPVNSEGQYDVVNLQDGMYLVRLLAADKRVIKTVRLSKN